MDKPKDFQSALEVNDHENNKVLNKLCFIINMEKRENEV